MPEGHTLHRAARLQRRRFAGHQLRVDSPQGRFTDGAALLDGRVLEGVEAVGKHLFYRWEDGITVHIHLGLFGRFQTFTRDAPEPTQGTRLRWWGEPGTLHLSGPTACDVMESDAEEQLLLRLGPTLSCSQRRRTTIAVGLCATAHTCGATAARPSRRVGYWQRVPSGVLLPRGCESVHASQRGAAGNGGRHLASGDRPHACR